jgi:hypothetical protein
MNDMATIRKTKTLADVKADMSELYESHKSGEIDHKTAAELTNITGKYLKAHALEFAERLFSERLGSHTLSQSE